MSRTAFIFPGQGAQFVGMGQEFYKNFPLAKSLYDSADKILGFSVTSVSFEGPEEELKQTRITQPAIFTLSVIIAKLLQEKGIFPQLAAGHSLGEYAALVAAEAIDFEDALKLVKLRGELMQRSGEDNPGTMAAIIGLSPEEVTDICTEAALVDVVQPANFNAPNQTVISGSVAGVDAAMEIAQKHNARKVVPLIVSGAFHSPLMSSAQVGLRNALENTELRDPKIPVYTNVTAEPIMSASEITGNLFKQVTHPVRWTQSIQNMIGDGADTFYELGPGKVLTALMRKNHREVNAKACSTPDTLLQLC